MLKVFFIFLAILMMAESWIKHKEKIREIDRAVELSREETARLRMLIDATPLVAEDCREQIEESEVGHENSGPAS